MAVVDEDADLVLVGGGSQPRRRRGSSSATRRLRSRTPPQADLEIRVVDFSNLVMGPWNPRTQ